jgi:hypothetical protein
MKKEFDVVYKHLMKLMMTSQTTKVSGSNRMAYLLDTEEFSQFERRLNNIVMQVHEVSENPVGMLGEMGGRQALNQSTPAPDSEASGGWKGKVSSAMSKFTAKGPMKIFSCVLSEDAGDRTVPAGQ